MFIELRLLDDVAYGSTYGQKFKTQTTVLKSGAEARNSEWTMPLGIYSLKLGLLRPIDHEVVIAAHNACMGSAIGFRFKDLTNFVAEDEVIGVGDGTSQVYPLTKTYVFGTGSIAKRIFKPVAATCSFESDGVPIAYTLDDTVGEVTITAPVGETITWSGEFDIPVRFREDDIHWAVEGVLEGGKFALSTDVDLQEIRV